MDEVVITGMGLVSCLGLTLDAVAQSLRHAVSGIDIDLERVERGFGMPLTGVVRGFDPRARLSRKERRTMGEPALYAAVAALDALDDAGLARDGLARPEVGVILGNDSTADAVRVAVGRVLEDGSTRRLGSGSVVECMNSTASMNLSVLLGTQGACWTLSGACASGAHAIGQGASLVATGQQEVVLVGGTQEINWTSMCAFDALGAFASWSPGQPMDVVRPFSADRTGLVPSGGSAVLVLEARSRAERRGAPVRAVVEGYAFSSDGTHVTTPSGEGARRAMAAALRNAGVAPGEVEYVNAHATGTTVGDAAEANALLHVFGARTPPVSSTKALTGHECWMAGASEVAYSLLMAEHGFLAANAHFTAPDAGLEAIDVIRSTREQRARLLLSNSFGFGGTNACLVLRAPDTRGGTLR